MNPCRWGRGQIRDRCESKWTQLTTTQTASQSRRTTQKHPNSRVVVPAAAGSSPVAHPSRIPANGVSLRQADRPVGDGDRFGDSFAVQLPPGPRRIRVAMSPRYGSAGTSPTLPRVPSRARQADRARRPRGAGGHRRRVRVRVDPVLPLPARSRPEWQGWLYRIAQREAWRLNAQRFGELSIVPDGESHERGTTREPADPRDRLEERLEFVAAMKELSRLATPSGRTSLRPETSRCARCRSGWATATRRRR